MESLTSYARQFLGQMDKPDVDSIEGLSPAISIDQKTTGRNPRSTVGTVTEIHDYLRLLWARVGVPHCPVCGREIRKQSVDEIVDAVCAAPEGTRMQVLSPLVRGRKGEHRDLLSSARKSGYVRVRIDGQMYDLEDTPELDKKKKHTIEIVVDRLIRRDTDEFRHRLAEDVETAAVRGAGLVIIDCMEQGETLYSMNYACPDCGVSIEELTPRMFSFNSPYGACPACSGLGIRMKITREAIFPDERVTLREGAMNLMGFNASEDNGIAAQESRRSTSAQWATSTDSRWIRPWKRSTKWVWTPCFTVPGTTRSAFPMKALTVRGSTPPALRGSSRPWKDGTGKLPRTP